METRNRTKVVLRLEVMEFHNLSKDFYRNLPTVRFLPDVHLDGKYPEMSGDNPKSGIFQGSFGESLDVHCFFPTKCVKRFRIWLSQLGLSQCTVSMRRPSFPFL